MAKSPAFRLYIQDFLVGTARMTAEQVGGYIRLLCEQWDKGYLIDDDTELLELSGVKSKSFAPVKKKFQICNDGNLRNARLEEERDKQIKYAEKQAVNGAKGGRPNKPNPNPEKPNPLPDESDTKAKKSFSFPFPFPVSPSEEKEKKGAQDFSDISEPVISKHRGNHCPTWKEVTWMFESVNSNEIVARAFFEHWEALGWKYNGQPLQHWQSKVNTWLSNAAEREKKAAPKNPIPATNGAYRHNGKIITDESQIDFRDFYKTSEYQAELEKFRKYKESHT